ncbi:MAG: hypothetical protein A2252_09490 [Elusimicrobia bacterium RIFOXYA2_FULL_39_19]|nr:MAG: hypothetical protein A2252_09490 [Elusimicrobia bacterium RIFOXYA2_FULL_39_19]
MKKALKMSAVTLFLISATIGLFAQMPEGTASSTGTNVKTEKKAAKAKMPSITGTVVSVDAQKLTVKPRKGAELVFVLNAETKFKKGRKMIALSDISTAEKVSIKYKKNAETNVAVTVAVKKAKKG